jgi:hypothetical protein
MNRVANSILHCVQTPQYSMWSRVGGFLVGNGMAYLLVKHDRVMDSNGVLKKMEWRDAYYASLLHLSLSIIGTMVGPVVPFLPILAIPGVLYKLTDSAPDSKKQVQTQGKATSHQQLH